MTTRAQERRKRALKKFGHLYLPFKPPGYWRDSACCYCGNLAQSRDHIPPLSWLAALGSSCFDEMGIQPVWVPACQECNSTLGEKRLFTIRERTLHLLGVYSQKYAKTLHGEVWSDEELNRLNGRLRQAIEQFATLQLAVDRRIAILEENLQLRGEVA